jgi:hypothetical protein
LGAARLKLCPDKKKKKAVLLSPAVFHTGRPVL